ncbi:DUF309 domain-containing protein [Alkalicoccobacillus murimartini]|uniref:Metal-dependent hydrolase n=1 Tax=Alkalicoccobacillus murimartini TaxID=171685 RepID=A0ABT9YF50_9BACI|nr:DUF309 domain-containing protein [Alkalicoccobacillus murimartini]MDQ0205842.1 putative metal-dependent hydrolase [Alkalicoccobacillus murimartini]
MTYPTAYIEYLIYFHGERDYFECHEVLEEHWKTTSKGEKNAYWVALIQIAVGLYHQRRGNLKGAQKMLQNAKRLVQKDPDSIQSLGLDTPVLETMLVERIQELEHHTNSYHDLNLPIKDPELLKLCQEKCVQLELEWCQVSPLSNEWLIHKHTLRDRQEVIKERAYQQDIRRQRK